MILQLFVKCVTLIAVIHAFRLIGRRAGPRASGLVLGLPSSTAILLVLCGREAGTSPAIEMAEANLLGLIAAVALPLAYARAVARGWGLAWALAMAVAAYVVVASGLGMIHSSIAGPHRLVLSFGSILAASWLATRIGTAPGDSSHAPPSPRGIAFVRTTIPVAYVVVVGVVTGVASPRWAGLVSTFPSMSTVVLAATHLEEGAAPAGRIARALPPANLSTAAFLTAFRFACPSLGMAGGVLCGYAAALMNLAAIEGIPRRARLRRLLVQFAAIPEAQPGSGRRTWSVIRSPGWICFRPAPHNPGRIRPPHRRTFAPRLEMLPC